MKSAEIQTTACRIVAVLAWARKFEVQRAPIRGMLDC
jgi:hypothetical protein